MSSSSVTSLAGPAMLIAFCLCCSSSSLLLAGPFSGLFEILKSFFEVGGGVTGAASEAASAAASGAGDLVNATAGLFGSRSSPMSQTTTQIIATEMQSSCFPCAPFGDEKCNETKTEDEQDLCAAAIDVTCKSDPSFHEYCPMYLESKPSSIATLNLSSSYTTASERAERDRTYTAEECFQCIPLTAESRGGIECSEIKINACEPTIKDTCLADTVDPAYYNACKTLKKLKKI